MKVLHKKSLVSGVIPKQEEIDLGEIAINAADAKIFIKSTSGEIVSINSNGTQLVGNSGLFLAKNFFMSGW